MTFWLPHLGHLIFALARSVMVSVASNSFSQLSHRNSYRGINSSSQLASARRVYLRFRLLQPKAHVHLAEHRRSGSEVLLRLLVHTRAPVELAEAQVAVGEEWPHAEFVGERHGLTIVTFGLLRVRRIGMGRNLATEVERPGLPTTLTAVTSKLQGSVAEGGGRLEPAVDQARFTETD